MTAAVVGWHWLWFRRCELSEFIIVHWHETYNNEDVCGLLGAVEAPKPPKRLPVCCCGCAVPVAPIFPNNPPDGAAVVVAVLVAVLPPKLPKSPPDAGADVVAGVLPAALPPKLPNKPPDAGAVVAG